MLYMWCPEVYNCICQTCSFEFSYELTRYEFQHWIVLYSSVRPSTSFSTDTDSPIFAVNRYEYRYDTDMPSELVSKRNTTAWLKINGVRRRLNWYKRRRRRRVPLICRWQSTTTVTLRLIAKTLTQHCSLQSRSIRWVNFELYHLVMSWVLSI